MPNAEDKIRKALNLKPRAFQGQARKLGTGEEDNDDERSNWSDRSQPSSSSSGARAPAAPTQATPQHSQGPQGSWAFRGKARTLSESSERTGKQPVGATAASSSSQGARTACLPDLPRGCGTGVNAADESLQLLLARRDAATTRLLARMCVNVIKEPRNHRYRTLKLSNAKVVSSLDACQGAGHALLSFVGFEHTHMHSEGNSNGVGNQQEQNAPSFYECLMLPESDDGSELARARVVLDSLNVVLEALGEQTLRTGPPPGPDNRFERAFAPSAACAAHLADLPASFYELSSDELKEELRKRKEKSEVEQVVASKDAKERMLKQRPGHSSGITSKAPPSETTIRVRMPDGLIAQGTFDANEDIGALLQWVSSIISDRGSSNFTLSLASRRIDSLDPRTKLTSAHLVPGGLLNLAWSPPHSAPDGASLRHDLAQRAVPLE